MFIVNNHQYLNIKTDISDQEKKYGRQIPKKSQPFIWSENLDDFLEICQNAINSFIDDCKEDSFEDLDEIGLGYLHKLNFPSAFILAQKYQNKFCHLLSEYNYLLIFVPFFNYDLNVEINQETFLINPITNIYIKDNKIFIEGFGYFIKDRNEYYYTNIEDFLNQENLIER